MTRMLDLIYDYINDIGYTVDEFVKRGKKYFVRAHWEDNEKIKYLFSVSKIMDKIFEEDLEREKRRE